MWNCVLETNEKQTNQSKFESFKKSLPKKTLFFLTRCERPGWHEVRKAGKGRGFLNNEDPEHELFCRDLRAFSGVIFPSFIFAAAQSLEQIENIVW